MKIDEMETMSVEQVNDVEVKTVKNIRKEIRNRISNDKNINSKCKFKISLISKREKSVKDIGKKASIFSLNLKCHYLEYFSRKHFRIFHIFRKKKIFFINKHVATYVIIRNGTALFMRQQIFACDNTFYKIISNKNKSSYLFKESQYVSA